MAIDFQCKFTFQSFYALVNFLCKFAPPRHNQNLWKILPNSENLSSCFLLINHLIVGLTMFLFMKCSFPLDLHNIFLFWCSYLPNNSFSTSLERSSSMLPNMVVEVGFKTSFPLALAYFQVIITKYIHKLIVEESFSPSLCSSPGLFCPSWNSYFQTTFSIQIFFTTSILLIVSG